MGESIKTTDPDMGKKLRQFALNVATDQVETFHAICRNLGITCQAGGRVRIRDWRNQSVKDGQRILFRRREDVETVLAYEQFLQKYRTLAPPASPA